MIQMSFEPTTAVHKRQFWTEVEWAEVVARIRAQ